MEQQNKLTEEEKAYQALRTQDMQDMPDLWSRIDTGFEPTAALPTGILSFPVVKSRTTPP